MILGDQINLGQFGCDLITDQAAHDGSWVVLEMVGAATFTELDSDTLTVNGAAGADNGTGALVRFAGLVVGDGRKLYGRFTHIKLGAGAVLGYRVPGGSM